MQRVIDSVREAEQFIRTKAGITADTEPEFGIILGTGLGGLVGEIEIEAEIPYEIIPHFPVSTVESHKGRLLLGRLSGRRVVAMQGRFHYYEGYSARDVVFPVRVMKFLGIRRLFVSNAAGSLSETIGKGDLMVLRDHINLLPESPFRGAHEPEFGPRFPDPLGTYDLTMVARALEIAGEKGIRCFAGVYVSVAGPQLETASEYQYLHRIGGDAVGMSTVPEALAAKQMNIPVFAISVITDNGYPPSVVEATSLEDVIRVASQAEPRMTAILCALVAEAE
ncbi:MAG: purine-nucleoside phosphorylase [Bacteroidetes bacterium]|nr:purine-nucleoside phosphorylase [Bacteroidota bacterium]